MTHQLFPFSFSTSFAVMTLKALFSEFYCHILQFFILKLSKIHGSHLNTSQLNYTSLLVFGNCNISILCHLRQIQFMKPSYPGGSEHHIPWERRWGILACLVYLKTSKFQELIKSWKTQKTDRGLHFFPAKKLSF